MQWSLSADENSFLSLEIASLFENQFEILAASTGYRAILDKHPRQREDLPFPTQTDKAVLKINGLFLGVLS
jgi:hypothetical protein